MKESIDSGTKTYRSPYIYKTLIRDLGEENTGLKVIKMIFFSRY
jgi:hypothetical protein